MLGAIFVWKVPEEVVLAKAENELPTLSKKVNDMDINVQNNEENYN